MLKQLVWAGAVALLLGGAAPTASSSAISPMTQSRVVDQCFDDCVVTCMRHTGADQTICQFECMATTCLANPTPEPTRLLSVTRKE